MKKSHDRIAATGFQMLAPVSPMPRPEGGNYG